MSETGHRRARKPRSDGLRSRQAILDQAAQLATVEGINGLTIGRLADAVGMSKSGLFAHFGSKEELQLATVETAAEVFRDLVTGPAARAPSGIERLRELCERFLAHVERRVFRGGCFFASVSAETAAQPGAIRDAVMAVEFDFFARLEAAVRDAQSEGDISESEDAEQLAFELGSYMALANTQFVITQDKAPINRARAALDRRLARAA